MAAIHQGDIIKGGKSYEAFCRIVSGADHGAVHRWHGDGVHFPNAVEGRLLFYRDVSGVRSGFVSFFGAAALDLDEPSIVK